MSLSMYNHHQNKNELDDKERELIYLKEVINSIKNNIDEKIGTNDSYSVQTDILKNDEKKRENIRILLAEDNSINQDVINEQMNALGYTIEIVDNGVQALSVIKQKEYDLILMDGHMPHMDGFATSKAIRSFEKANNRITTPIIALTADISPNVKKHCTDVGMNDYLAKPFCIDDLDSILIKWLHTGYAEKDTSNQSNNNEAIKSLPNNISSDILNLTVIEQLQTLSQKSGRNTLSNAIKQYRTTALNQLDSMHQAAIDKDHSKLASIAHSLKSASGTLGVNHVYSATSEIEEFAIANNIEPALQAINSLGEKLTLSLYALDDVTENFQQTAATQEPTSIPVIGDNQKLLIVDDDQVTLHSLNITLQTLGYDIDVAHNGEEALILLSEGTYDLVITDLQMPGMNGYALCEAIRKEYTVETLPILVLTSTADDVCVHDAYKIGISNFIVKPVNYINLAYSILFTIQNTRNAHELLHNRQLLDVAENVAEVSYWSCEIDTQKIQFSRHLQCYFDPSLDDINTLEEFISTMKLDGMRSAIKSCISNKKESSWEQEITHSQYEKSLYILHRFCIIQNENNNSVLIATVQNISSIRHAEQHITDLAFYDSLTKLNSRSSFNKKLQELISRSERKTEKFALLYLDLDNFKNINDSFGHDVGDKLLKEVANRLRTLLRKYDFASRLGGDEFCLLIHDISDNISAANVAQRCLEILSQPLKLPEREISPHASIGIAIYPQNGSDANFLIKAADTAMYEAKNNGKDQYAFYEPAMTDAAHLRLVIENDLRTALYGEQFELYYQPKISLSSGNVQSVEALIRWNHPEKGLCPPDSFIPEAERMGLIAELGEWVVKQACKQIKLWEKQGLKDMPVAVNISPSHFAQESFADDIAELVNQLDISPSLIEIEITESTSRDHTVFTSTCKKLRSLGFKMAIDDFGTGYSSLSVLKDAPVDVLKIDREFIRHIPNDSQSSILIGTILGMSKALGLQVVAEGIETEEQLTVLIAMGCHMAQGYYFSKPVPAKEIPALTKCCFRRPKENRPAAK